MFHIFIKNKIIATNQSGFKPGDICINQWLSVTHDIYRKFEGWGLWGQRSFPWYMKAFDKVWLQDIVFKLKENDISGNMLEFLADFLKERNQRVGLNGKVSNRADVTTGVPQRSILDSLLFLIYINDLAAW